jgi:RNA polymerase sigma-70 factor (ECF subfamily)
MGSTNRFEGIDEYAANLIRHKARQLARRPEFSQTDQEDLEQEMILDLLRRLPQYDPQRSPRNAFITRVVNHMIARLIEFHRAGSRDSGTPTGSLNHEVVHADGSVGDLVQTVDEAACHRRTGITSFPERERLDMKLDVETALRDLPEDLRRLCKLLQSKTVTEISRETGIPRPTLYDAMERVKERFQKAGLKKIG